MKTGRVSKTALKVAWITVVLADRRDWGEPLPKGSGPITERLLLAANQPMYRGGMIALARSGVGRWMTDRARPQYAALARRRSFVNQQARAAIEAGATQVLVVGAGFDTLCLRLAPAHPGVRFVEIDHPATAAAKARGIDAVGAPENLEQRPVDLATTPLREVLGELQGWDPRARTFVVAEGLLMYLAQDQILELFGHIAASTGPGSRVAFSHLRDLARFNALTLWMLRIVGEPWLSSWTEAELPDAMSAMGWRVIAQDQPRPRDYEGCACVERADDEPPEPAGSSRLASM